MNDKIKYDNVKFIKISDNNNANKNFYIDITNMKDARLRVSALKSQYKKYKKDPTSINYREIFDYFELDYSWYVLEYGSFNTYEEVLERRKDIYDEQFIKMNPELAELPEYNII